MPYVVDTPPALVQAVKDAVAAAVPKPATAMPPGVGVDGATGTDTTQYALANHTHATSVQRARLTVSPAGQPVRWIFAKPYDPGVVPVVTCTAQNTAGATQPFVVNTSSDPTSTYADLVVFKAQTQTVTGLIGTALNAVVNVFGVAPSGTVVNCQAGKPTQ